MTDNQQEMIFGIPIVSTSLSKIHLVVKKTLNNPGKKIIFYINAHCVVLASQNSKYKKVLNEASLVYSGGVGPIIASKILGKPLKERTPTPDFINSIFKDLQKNSKSIYLLGSSHSSIEKAVSKIKEKFPKLKIVGFSSGYLNSDQEKNVIREINQLKPAFIFVGMGSPSQEFWISRNKDHLNAEVFWTVGAMFDVISGKLPRAPKWIQDLKLEWLYRMFQEPRRLWQRYTIGILQFMLIVMKEFYRTKIK